MIRILYVPGQGDSDPAERLLYRLLASTYDAATDFIDFRAIQDEIDRSIFINGAIDLVLAKIDDFKPHVLVGHSIGLSHNYSYIIVFSYYLV